MKESIWVKHYNNTLDRLQKHLRDRKNPEYKKLDLEDYFKESIHWEIKNLRWYKNTMREEIEGAR